jgi:anti-sigma factor RsiW
LGRHTKVNRCITEGRRAFIARYARIEGGDECERWLPLLSAIVDGEATPEQLMEVRPHLRHCTACRATVRELHATSAPLAALFPVALAPAMATSGPRACSCGSTRRSPAGSTSAPRPRR